MKIGIYVPHLDPHAGGGFSFPYTILETLEKQKTNHSFIIFYPGDIQDLPTTHLPVVQLPKKNSKKRLISLPIPFQKGNSQQSVLNTAIFNHQIEIMWFISPRYIPVDIPFIIPVWDLQHRLQPFFPEVSTTGWKWENREKFYSSVLPKAAYVLTGTLAGKKEIVDFYHIPKERIKLLPHPTPKFALETHGQQGIQPKIKIPNNFLFYPAQFWPHKNHIALLKALKIIIEKYKINLSLILTGTDWGNKQYVQDVTHQLDLDKNVFFLGFVNIDELIWLYKHAFALTYVTFFGPENLPPLEAFALGCPVIASKVSGANEQLGDAALFVNPKDENDIAQSVLKLISNQNLREKLVKKGNIKAKLWTSGKYIDEICKIVDDFESYRRCWSTSIEYKHL